MSDTPDPTREELATLAQLVGAHEGVTRINRLIASVQDGVAARDLIVRALRGEGVETRIIGVRTFVENGREMLLFRRGHPYLDEIMQDTDEPDRTWEKALLRMPAVRGGRTEYGRVIFVPVGYVWAAIEIMK